MKRTLTLLIAGTVCVTCSAQTDEWKDASKESLAYHAYREKITRPPYELEKILGMIKKISTDKTIGDDEDNSALSPQSYSRLSLREKFTYNMVHGESYSQNCDAMPPIQDEQKKIFAQLPDVFGEYSWSTRQRDFFVGYQDSVVSLMTASIERTNRVGLNYKKVIVDLNAREMIPLLIRTYNVEKKDHDILTVLMLLMAKNSYGPFLSSVSYKKLYADKESSYTAYLAFNAANETLILQRATEFYNGLFKKG